MPEVSSSPNRKQVFAVFTDRGALLVWAWATLLCTATCWLFWPGLFSFDSIYIYRQVVGDQPINNYHPPAMVYVWQALHPLAGPGAMLLLHQLLYWSGLALIVLAACRRTLARLVSLTLIGLLPPLWIHSVTVWNDTGVVTAWLFAVGCLLWLNRTGRASWLLLGFLGLTYGVLVRHNALFAALPLFLALADAWWGNGSRPSIRSHSYMRSVLLPGLASFLLVVTAGQMFERAGVAQMTKWTTIAVWDLAAVSLLENQLLLPRSALNHPDEPEKEALERLDEAFHAEVNGPLIAAADLFPRNGNEAELLSAWLLLPVSHTRAYAAHRTRVFFGLLGLGRVPLNLAYQGTMETNDYGLELTSGDHPLMHGMLRIIDWSEGTVLFRPWLYLVILAGATAWLARRRRIGPTFPQHLPLYLAASALMGLLPLYVLAPATDFRYVLWLVAVSSVLACVGLCGRNS